MMTGAKPGIGKTRLENSAHVNSLAFFLNFFTEIPPFQPPPKSQPHTHTHTHTHPKSIFKFSVVSGRVEVQVEG